MKLTETEQAAVAVIRHIVRDRDMAIQIPARKLAEICALHGLGQGLPPLSANMDHMWRDYLLRLLGGRPWKIGRRWWRIRCPYQGNFHLTPTTKPWAVGR